MSFTVLQDNNVFQLPEVSDQFLRDYFDRNKILTTDKNSNTKISKSNQDQAYRTGYVAMLPSDFSGFKVCPNDKYCKNSCIFKSGQNRFDNAVLSKYYKSLMFWRLNDRFMSQLSRELDNFRKTCFKSDLYPAVRLNTYSDIEYEKNYPELFEQFYDIQFYDYTKIYKRFDRKLPNNYDLTLSLIAEVHNFEDIHNYATNRNIRCSAVISRKFYKDLLSTMNQGETSIFSSGIGSVDLVDGEKHDMTFKHDKGKVLILRDKSGSKDINPLVYRDIKDFCRVI